MAIGQHAILVAYLSVAFSLAPQLIRVFVPSLFSSPPTLLPASQEPKSNPLERRSGCRLFRPPFQPHSSPPLTQSLMVITRHTERRLFVLPPWLISPLGHGWRTFSKVLYFEEAHSRLLRFPDGTVSVHPGPTFPTSSQQKAPLQHDTTSLSHRQLLLSAFFVVVDKQDLSAQHPTHPTI